MKLLSFSLQNFRNLERVAAVPHPRFTLVCGENGQGKTNLLEGIYYLLALRPLRPAKASELVRLGQGEANLTGEIDQDGVARSVAVRLSRGLRALSLGGNPVAEVDRYLEAGAVVAFTPDELAIVRAAPERRRRYLDRAVFTRWPAYLVELREYQRLLRSRNRILQERGPVDLRESFEIPLARAGARLWMRRRAWLEEVSPHFTRAFDRIGRLSEEVALSYPAAGEGTEADLASRLLSKLHDRLSLDEARGFTSVGPHADDLRLAIGGLSARVYASQGQGRAIVLSLKVAEIENLREKLGAAPLLLLDDVSSELDPARNRELLGYLRELSAQVLLTTTDPGPLLPRLQEDAASWRVDAGVVTV